jgi:hypothetical protein
MPTRPKKGGTPDQNAAGRTKAGGQKAVTGSGRSPEVAGEAKKATQAGKAGKAGKKVVVNHEEQVSPDKK